MNDKKMLQFIEWLGANVPELKGQSPEQIMTTINQLAETPEGQQMLEGLVQQFESSSTGMFKKGGKLDYLLCLKKGGNVKNCGCGKKIENKREGGYVIPTDYDVTNLPTPASYVPAEEAAFSVARNSSASTIPAIPAMPVKYRGGNSSQNKHISPQLTGGLYGSTDPYGLQKKQQLQQMPGLLNPTARFRK